MKAQNITRITINYYIKKTFFFILYVRQIVFILKPR